ncbi:hypothetical protein C8J57DRAFT_1509184 [Mycena rebaudengoi]|nr:hypothetical protein C8J57DRAFT_1509184 [Mycena rebaudengoi]
MPRCSHVLQKLVRDPKWIAGQSTVNKLLSSPLHLRLSPSLCRRSGRLFFTTRAAVVFFVACFFDQCAIASLAFPHSLRCQQLLLPALHQTGTLTFNGIIRGYVEHPWSNPALVPHIYFCNTTLKAKLNVCCCFVGPFYDHFLTSLSRHRLSRLRSRARFTG